MKGGRCVQREARLEELMCEAQYHENEEADDDDLGAELLNSGRAFETDSMMLLALQGFVDVVALRVVLASQ